MLREWYAYERVMGSATTGAISMAIKTSPGRGGTMTLRAGGNGCAPTEAPWDLRTSMAGHLDAGSGSPGALVVLWRRWRG
jgi:hypothetical protein